MIKFQLGNIVMRGVSKNRILQNKTSKYLLPILKEYGDVFTGKFNAIFKVACGTGDFVVQHSGINYERHIFILIDTTISTKQFLAFMDWIKFQPYYENDYVYGNIQKSKYHMVVLKIPEKFYESLETFKRGKYSQMYSYKDIGRYFHNHPDIKKVLIRDHNYKLEFISQINKDYGVHVDDFDIEDYELDYPANTLEETF